MWNRQDKAVKTRDPGAELKTLLVPVDGSEASNKAIEFACAIAKRNRGKVHVVHVVEVKRALPLDAELVSEATQGEQILDEAERLAKRFDMDVEGDLLQAREAGHAIIDEAMERHADAIVLGVPFRRPFGEFEMGRVPAHVLRSAPCQVILLRQQAG